MSSGQQQIELYSPKFYAYCGVGGILSCGITHTMITPVDLVKCRMQTGYQYPSTIGGIRAIAKEGFGTLFTGWAPTAVGYSFQGLCKFGFYEIFKKKFADAVGDENAVKYRTWLFMGASASAEFFADIALCPWEAVKVRVQTFPGFAKGLSDGLPKMVREEGVGTLFKGLVPLWTRQIPYTIMKFTAFERIVETIYKTFMSRPRHEYNKLQQLGVSFVGGYIAGVFCAVVSHPADVIVSQLNRDNSKSLGQVARELGFKGSFVGLMPRIFMIGTLTALQWLIYDTFKVTVGLPTSGGKVKDTEPKK